jgi:hypothetical protein
LAKSLLEDHKLTMVETMKKNKRDLSPEFINTKRRSPMTIIFGFQHSITIALFVPKYIMIYTLHYDYNANE